ncbi:MAG: TIGR00730 family Rossman fold protein [Myxococcota bacterium]
MGTFKRVCVYCGSSDDIAPAYREVARSVGTFLAESGIQVVYGGGRVGLMGEVANAALEAGGQVYGVIPRKLQMLEVGHEGLDELFVVESMHARKTLMASMSDAFIALPGGFGTLEELAEVTTWTQLGYHKKPVGLLNVNGYYDHLLGWIEHAAKEGFIRPVHRGLIESAATVDVLMDKLAAADLPDLERWMPKT